MDDSPGPDLGWNNYNVYSTNNVYNYFPKGQMMTTKIKLVMRRKTRIMYSLPNHAKDITCQAQYVHK